MATLRVTGTVHVQVLQQSMISKSVGTLGVGYDKK